MDLKRFISTAFVFLFVIFGVYTLALSEDNQAPASSAPVSNTENKAAPAQAPSIQPGNETQWVWGEVVSLDNQNKTLTLKYLDYESDQEKEMVIGADETTKYENVSSLDGIKTKDNLSVDYIVNAQGQNIAKNISLEKAESTPVAPETTQVNQPPAAPIQPEPAVAPANPAPEQPAVAPTEATPANPAPESNQAAPPVTPAQQPASQSQ